MNDEKNCMAKLNRLMNVQEINLPELGAFISLTTFKGVKEKLYEVFFDYFHPFGIKYQAWTSEDFSLDDYTEEKFIEHICTIIAKKMCDKNAQPELIPYSLLEFYPDLHIRCIRALPLDFAGNNDPYAEVIARRLLSSSFYRSHLQPDVSYQSAIMANINHEIYKDGIRAYLTKSKIIALKTHMPKVLSFDEKQSTALSESKFKILTLLRQLEYLRNDESKISILEKEYYKSKQAINIVRQTMIKKQLFSQKSEPELPRWE